MRGRCVCLPKGHEVRAKFKLPAQNSGVQHRGDGLTHLHPEREELEIGSVADARAPVDKGAVLQALRLTHLGNWRLDPGSGLSRGRRLGRLCHGRQRACDQNEQG